jgi:hypothetical protein
MTAVKPAVDAATTVAAKVAEKVAEEAVTNPAAAAAATKGLSGTGIFGLGAGAVGMTLTLINAWKESVGSQRGITAGSIVNPSTVAIGGGAALLTLGEKVVGSSPIMRAGVRSAGMALVLGGLVGAIVGAVHTFGNPLHKKTEAATSTQSQSPVRFGTELPPAPQNLAGVEMASADVIGKDRKLEHLAVYVDPATAEELPDGTTLGSAIGEARAAAQGDEQFRSHAVVQTKDGHYWVVRLTGALDQVDGPKYSDGTGYDDRYDPQLGRRQQALQAIAGVESHYAFPEGMEPTAPAQYAGEIPWVTPTLPKSTATTAPKTTSTDAKAGS